MTNITDWQPRIVGREVVSLTDDTIILANGVILKAVIEAGRPRWEPEDLWAREGPPTGRPEP